MPLRYKIVRSVLGEEYDFEEHDRFASRNCVGSPVISVVGGILFATLITA